MPKEMRDARIAQRSPVLEQHMGLIFRGTVTTYTNITHFKISALPEYGDPADFPNDIFLGYYVYVLWDTGGTGAAPQGESRLVSGYTSSDGTVTHTAFTVPLAVGDIVLLVHPDVYNAAVLADVGDASSSTLGSLYGILGNPGQSFLTMVGYEGATSLAAKLTTARAGYIDIMNSDGKFLLSNAITGEVAFSLYDILKVSATEKLKNFIAKTGGTEVPAGTSLYDELADILDLTRTYAAVAVTVAETNLFIDDAPVRATAGRSVKVDLTNVAAGDTYVIREYYRLVAMGAYVQVSDDASNTYVGVQTPVIKTVSLDTYLYGCKITAQKIAGTDRTINYESFVEA